MMKIKSLEIAVRLIYAQTVAKSNSAISDGNNLMDYSICPDLLNSEISACTAQALFNHGATNTKK